jgi:hypothetical protein
MRYWEKLMIKWRADGKDGLTIPFLIGTRTYFEAEQELLSVHNLFADMIINAQSKLYIKYCFEIGEIIVGIFDTSKEKNAGEFLDFNSKTQTAFFVTKPFVDDWKADFHYGIDYLSERYEITLRNKHYSFVQREWRTFDSKDLEFIQRTRLSN